MPQNPTQNQHFVSQSEQRLNAVNPNAQPRKQKIYVFTIEDRNNPTLRICDKPRKIENNLSWQDLFSYHIPALGSVRENFEDLFQAYEGLIWTSTHNLLEKLATNNFSVRSELTTLFCAKYLNILRNPHNLEQLSGMLDIINGFRFVDPELAREFERVQDGNKPQRGAVCARFGLTEEGYDTWLRALFFVLRPFEDGSSVLDRLMQRFFDNSVSKVQVCCYHQQCCLLSDRGHNLINCEHVFREMFESGTMERGHNFGAEFNLSRNAFISYMFLFGEGFPEKDCQELLGKIIFRYEVDSIAELAAYNRETISQSVEEVYCASKEPLLSAAGMTTANPVQLVTQLL